MDILLRTLLLLHVLAFKLATFIISRVAVCPIIACDNIQWGGILIFPRFRSNNDETLFPGLNCLKNQCLIIHYRTQHGSLDRSSG